jgi:hypothetical protein
MANNTGRGTFKKGDPRINRNGRPRAFDKLRALTIDMFTKPALDSVGNKIYIENKPVTIIEYILWKMIHSKDPRDVRYALEIAYGKVPDKIDITSAGASIKQDDRKFDRAISTLADAIRESLSGKDSQSDSSMDASEQATVAGVSKPSG